MTVELLVKATLILGVVALAALALRKTAAATRHLVQVLGLVAVLALPLAAALLPTLELPVLTPRAKPTFYDGAALPALTGPRLDLPERSSPRSDDERADSCPCPAAPMALPGGDDDALQLLASVPATPGGGSSGATASIPWLFVAWLAGVAAVLGRLAVGWLRMTRLAIDASPLTCEATWEEIHFCRRRLGIRRVPRVLTSASVRVPALWGFLKPTLLLPADVTRWQTARLRAVLLHELAHLKRYDGLALLLGRLAAAVWWFHPVAWWVERSARRDCERACDDVVLATGERPSTYARHLLEIVRELPAGRPAPAGALSLLGPGMLEERMRAILRPGVRRGMNTRTAAATLSVALVALVSVSSAELVARTGGPSTPRMDVARSEAPPPRVETAEADVVRTVDRRADARKTHPAGEPEILLAHDGDHDRNAGRDVYKRAYELHRAERWLEAAEGFRAAADAGYRPSTSFYNAACGYARLGRAGEALRWIERAIDEGFDSWELLYEDKDLDPIRTDAAFRDLLADVGERHDDGRRGDRLEEAANAYEELLDEGSENPEAWYRAGSALLSVRDFDRAVDALERAAELSANDGNALYNLACAHALQGDARRALDHLERAVLAGFDSDERFENDSDLASIRDSKRFAEIRELHDTLSLDRFRKGRWGSDEYSADRWRRAIDEYRAFVAREPDVGRAWFNLGWALHFSRRHSEAREAFERQRSLGYRPALATYNIACTHAMEGDNAAALDALERALDEGSFAVGQLIGDDDLRGLHDDPRFEALLEQAAESDDLEEYHERHRAIERWKEKRKPKHGH